MVFVEDYDAKNKAHIYFQLLKNKQTETEQKQRFQYSLYLLVRTCTSFTRNTHILEILHIV